MIYFLRKTASGERKNLFCDMCEWVSTWRISQFPVRWKGSNFLTLIFVAGSGLSCAHIRVLTLTYLGVQSLNDPGAKFRVNSHHVCLSIRPSICLSVHCPIDLCPTVCQSVFVSVLSVFLSWVLSVLCPSASFNTSWVLCCDSTVLQEEGEQSEISSCTETISGLLRVSVGDSSTQTFFSSSQQLVS